MEPSANLILSEPELAKVQDANWIFTKHLIMEKAAAILRGQVQEINNQFNFLLQWDAPANVFGGNFFCYLILFCQ